MLPGNPRRRSHSERLTGVLGLGERRGRAGCYLFLLRPTYKIRAVYPTASRRLS